MALNGSTHRIKTAMAVIIAMTASAAWSGVMQTPLGEGQDGENAVQYQLNPQLSTQEHSGKKAPEKSKRKTAPMDDMGSQSQSVMPSIANVPAQPTMQIRGNAMADPKFKSMNPGEGGVRIRSGQPGVQLQGHTQMDTGLKGGVQTKSDGHDNRNNMNIGGMQSQ